MARLEIITLKITDYRQYYGEVTIDLKTTGDKNINVIEGENGAGKSNILNSITLCLYGKESHLQSKEDSGLEAYPYVNRKRLSEVGENEAAEGSIEVTLGRGEPQYIFTRTFRTVKLPGEGYSSTHSDLQLKQKTGHDWQSIENPNTRLNQILPVNVHEYFLFDGERLDDFFAEGYQERVKKGLLDVSHIDLLDRSIDHVGKVEKTVESKIEDVGGEAEQKLRDYERADEKLSDKEEELESIKQEIETSWDLIAEIDRKLQDSSDPDVRSKQERREFLSNRLKDKREEIKRLHTEVSQAIVEAGPALYSRKSLEYTLTGLTELSNKGELPPKIQTGFVQELIERGKCICGEDLTEEHRKHLRGLRDEMSKVVEENIEGKYTIPTLLQDAKEEVDTLVEKRKQLAKAEDEEDEINRNLKEISEELQSYNLPEGVDVKELEKQRSDYETQITELTESKGRVKVEIETAERERNEKQRQYKDAASKKNENAEILKQIDFLEAAKKKLTSIKEKILLNVRTEIQDRMDEYFNEIIWKDEEYSVTLNEDYFVRVEGPHNDNKIGSLSAGERQVLAFSFLAALTKVSGFSAPIIIDTPLGRISSTPKKRIAQNLPRYIDDTQVTFLMTDEEYTDDVRVNMKSSISNEYKLKFADEVTEVVAYEY
ncbi:AAA family ATPase [Salinigranum halophilum]|uniref:AAA family ATPase n=1 Tax=Salinigranum halophilum TaxID=2565931 RepID=UPI001F3B5BA9|nr:AAA family ATPase [Salinigranum halophilum]